MKHSKKLCELTDREASFANKCPQCSWLELFSSPGNAEVPSIAMVKDGMSSLPVVKREANPSERFDSIVSSYYR